MRKIVWLIALMHSIVFVQGQDKNRASGAGTEAPVQNQRDTIRERDRASMILRGLKDGSLIVRLKTNQKSVDAYRKAGQEQIAKRIEQDRKDQNLRMYWAFQNHFRFCKVYFIYAHETAKFQNGARGLFLNEQLQPDPSILFSDTAYVFCEYGSAQPFSDFTSEPFENKNIHYNPDKGTGSGTQNENRHIQGNKAIEKTTATATTSGLVIFDKDLRQMGRPFPYVVPVLGENYNAPVKALSRDLERSYGRLVIRRDYNSKVKEMRKKQKEEWKILKPSE